METPDTNVAAPARVADLDTTGLVCLRCGYDLTGLQASGACPECGTPVERSLHGNLLRYSSPEYLKKLHIGVFVVLASIVVLLLVMIGMFGFGLAAGAFVAPPQWVLFTLSLVGLAGSVAFMVGWWLLSEPDPAFQGGDDGGRARRLVRAMVIVSAAITGVIFLVEYVLSYSTDPTVVAAGGAAGIAASVAVAANVLGFIVWAVQYFASMKYVQWLTNRIPAPDLERRAKRLMWLGPVLYFPGCLLFGLGPLIALILYWNLLEEVRKQIKRIRREEVVG